MHPALKPVSRRCHRSSHRIVPAVLRPAFTLALCIPALAVCAHATSSSTGCARLSGLKLRHTTIAQAVAVPAGPFTLNGPFGIHSVKLPAFCRVSGAIAPVSGSSIGYEVWLPLANWNGRYEGVGNGGLAGNISYEALADALRSGYAAASTDTGHKGMMMNGEWALGHPQRIIDYGYRAVHEMTVKAKAIITAFYGSPASYSYWNGCSEGGSQALTEAQRYPSDYNGILAGAPANYMVHLQAGGNWISQAIHEDPASFIPASKLPAIQKAVLAQCDAADGVRDGILEDPRTCHFNPGTMICDAAGGPDCLTRAQADGLRKIYDGARNPRTGQLVFPGYMRGGEAGWALWIAGDHVPPRNLQHGISVQFFQNFVFDNPDWDWKTFDFDKDVAFADKKAGAITNHIDPNLSAFKRHGGRLLQYHGWNDPAISPLNSINYFESVQRRMGNTSGFYRLFMIPGMEHCGGGPGASRFDHMAVIRNWVEKNEAPDRIVAGRPGRTHPLCPYPQIATYSGSGSTDDAAGYTCALPPDRPAANGH